MLRTFRYRLYPTPRQEATLVEHLRLCQRLYNAALEQRITRYNQHRLSPGKAEQQKELPALKLAFPEYRSVHSQVLQNVLLRLDRAFDGFFRRLTSGSAVADRAGFPRFKSAERYDSITYPQSGFRLTDDFRRIDLSKIGLVRVKVHRRIPEEGRIKTCTIRRSGRQWYVSLSVELPEIVSSVASDRPAIGIDLGLERFATYSDGTQIENPRWLRRNEERLKTYQRNGAKKKASRLHRKIASQRSDFLHKLSRTIVSKFGLIAVEDLNIRQMIGDNRLKLQKSIHDAGWGGFIWMLVYKAAEAGTQMVKVNPRGTSQRCSGCGTMVEKELSCREHRCGCGLVLDRDHNAARNILSLGRSVFGKQAQPAI